MAVNQRHVAGAGGNAGQVVGAHNDGGSGGAQPVDDVQKAMLGVGIQAVHGLVQQQYRRPGRNGPRQQRQPPLAAGKLADGTAAQIHQANGSQGFGGGFAVGPAVGAEQAPLRRQPHQRHIPHRHREVPVHLLQLGHEADLFPHPRAGAAVHQSLARVRFHQPHHRLEQGRLAAPVGANHAGQAAGRNGERHSVQRQDGAVPHRQVFKGHGLRRLALVGVRLAGPRMGMAVNGERLWHRATVGTSHRQPAARDFRRPELGTAA